MNLNYEIIGNRIRELRKEKNWTQVFIAEKSGVEPSNISHIERAATKVSLPTLVSIANALEVSLDEIVYGNLIKNAHISIKIIDDLVSDCSDQELIALAEVIKTTKNVLRAKK
ncbi:MAG: helix-turn-helix transcriptional regulator [Oscillospiraceae bacterium]|nr:helix-turn-helix transcriptional regulator [Oscillospiraceae bacterium]